MPVAGRRAPSLFGGDGWQRSGPRSVSQLRGRVGLVWFFSLSSPTCVSMVAGLRALQQAHPDDLAVIGVHTPDHGPDGDPERLARGSAMAGMTWPVLMDHRRRVFDRWQQVSESTGWPRTFVIARDGTIAAEVSGDDLDTVAIAAEAALAAPRPQA